MGCSAKTLKSFRQNLDFLYNLDYQTQVAKQQLEDQIGPVITDQNSSFHQLSRLIAFSEFMRTNLLTEFKSSLQ
jgi:hypothetical protein